MPEIDIDIDVRSKPSSSSTTTYNLGFTQVGGNHTLDYFHDSILDNIAIFGDYLVELWRGINPKELEFKEQEKAFNALSESVLSQYRGQFVISLNGVIVDNDDNLQSLVDRFYSTHDDIPIYIAKVGGPMSITLHTPLN